MKRGVIFCLICMWLAACAPETYTPKPKGYFRLDLPNHVYQSFDNPEYPYSFEYPIYGKIMKDTMLADAKKPENKYWLNIDFPSIGGRIYLSYKAMNSGNDIQKLLEDTHTMSYYHLKRADNIQGTTRTNQHGVMMLVYNVSGNAASAYQFIATDSVKHFLRGAVYFDAIPNADSLAPANKLLGEDLDHLMNTLKWRD